MSQISKCAVYRVTPVHHAYVLPAVTVVAITNQNMEYVTDQVTANYLTPNSMCNGKVVFTPHKFMHVMHRPKDAEHHFSGGLTTIASLPRNKLPSDQKCNKHPVETFQFKKYTVMNKEDNERKCSNRFHLMTKEGE